MSQEMPLMSTALEERVAEVLERLDARATRGPNGEHDWELTFPRTFVRKINNSLSAHIDVAKKIVVEVKSSLRGGAGLRDLRQLDDWVMRESRRLLSAEELEMRLRTLDLARSRVDLGTLRPGLVNYTHYEREDFDSSMLDLLKAIDIAVPALLFRVKGLLVINPEAGLSTERRSRVVEPNALQFAIAHNIAITTWPTLQEAVETHARGELDSLDFWCSLYEKDGIFDAGACYDWRRLSMLQPSLFEPEVCSVHSSARFIRSGMDWAGTYLSPKGVMTMNDRQEFQVDG